MILGLVGFLLSTVLPLVLIGGALWGLACLMVYGLEWCQANWFGAKPAGRAAKRAGRRAWDWANTDTSKPRNDRPAQTPRQEGTATQATAPDPAGGHAKTQTTWGGGTTGVGGTTTATGRTPKTVQTIGPEHIEQAGQKVGQSSARGEQHGFATATTAKRAAAYTAGFGRGARAGAKAGKPDKDSPSVTVCDDGIPDDKTPTKTTDPTSEANPKVDLTKKTPATDAADEAPVIPWKKEGNEMYVAPGEITDLAALTAHMQAILKELGAGEDFSAEMTAMSSLADGEASLSERCIRDMGAEVNTALTAYQEAAGIFAAGIKQALDGLTGMTEQAEVVRKEAETTRGDSAAA